MQRSSIDVVELKAIVSCLWEVHSHREGLAEAFFTDEKKFLEAAPTPFGWAEFYSLPLISLSLGMQATIDQNGELVAGLKTRSTVTEVQDLLDRIDIEEIDLVDFGEGKEHSKYLFLCFWFALLRSLESIQVYGRSLNRMAEDVANGNEKALFDAVKLDHSFVQNKHAMRLIAIAELKQDKIFFKKLANSFKSRPLKHSPVFYKLRYLLALTHEVGSLDKLSIDEAYELFCVELEAYDFKGADPAGSLWQFIRRWKKDNVKDYYST